MKNPIHTPFIDIDYLGKIPTPLQQGGHFEFSLNGSAWHLKRPDGNGINEILHELVATNLGNILGMKTTSVTVAKWSDELFTASKILYRDACTANTKIDFDPKHFAEFITHSFWINDHDFSEGKWDSLIVNNVGVATDIYRIDFSHSFYGVNSEQTETATVQNYHGARYITQLKDFEEIIERIEQLSDSVISKVVRSAVRRFIQCCNPNKITEAKSYGKRILRLLIKNKRRLRQELIPWAQQEITKNNYQNNNN